MTGSADVVHELVCAVVEWASTRPDVMAVALVGSYAREAATPWSDIDLVVLTDCPGQYFEDAGWAGRFGGVKREEVEEWGKVTSLRVWYANGAEVEFGFTAPDWAEPPADEGTQRVIADGIKVVFDRDGALSSLQGS